MSQSDENKKPGSLSLPYKVMTNIIDRLEPEDRVRFRLSSKWLQLLATPPKKEVYGLELQQISDTNWCIHVLHGVYISPLDIDDGYVLDFKTADGSTYVRCFDMNLKELWKYDIDYVQDVSQFTAEYFRYVLYPYQNYIKKINLKGYSLDKFDFGIQSLATLELLKIRGDADPHQFLSKIEHPLKDLSIYNKNKARSFSEYRQIYDVQDCLYLPYTALNYKQCFYELKSSWFCIALGNLTPDDIFRFIDCWRNEGFYLHKGNYEWLFHDTFFDLRRLLSLLRINEYELTNGQDMFRNEVCFDIKQSAWPYQTAELKMTGTYLSFRWESSIFIPPF